MGPQAPSGFNYTQHNCNTQEPKPKGRKNRYCGNYTLFGVVEGKYAHKRFRCKSYSCARCGPRKIRQVRKRIVQHAVEHKLQRFLTLTLDPKKLEPGLDLAGKIHYLAETWRKMRVYIRRMLGHSLKYIGVMELQGNGNPHLHLLVGSYLPKKWISEAWQALGGGWSVRIEYTDVHRVAAYLAKYISHDSLCDLPPGTRRFMTSKGMALFARSDGKSGWMLIRAPIDLFREGAQGVSDEKFETETDGSLRVAWFVSAQIPPPLAGAL